MSFKHVPDQAQQDVWQMKGRVSVRALDVSQTLGIQWRQTQDQFDIRFTAALGISVARIHGDMELVTLETDEGIYQAGSAEELLSTRTMLPLPLKALTYWLQGEPAPDMAFSWRGDTLSQMGWQIVYKRFENKQAPRGRPTRMKLHHPDVDLNLAVSSWQ